MIKPRLHADAASIEDRCVTRGMRMTEQRRIIARTLEAATDHPDAQSRAAAISGQALAAAQPVLRQRARSDAEAERIVAGYAARAFKAGRPAVLLAQCGRRFPPPPEPPVDTGED